MHKILITNDDGIFSIGLKPLIKQLKKIADVVVVVPETEQSAVSHSLTLHEPIKIKKIDNSTYVVNGTPADCVRVGIIEICKNKIDLVISGINSGPNLGYDVVYSGTVAAARESVLMNISGFAISLANYKKSSNFDTAAVVTKKITELFLNNKFIEINKPIFLNINVPDLPLKKIRCFSITRLGTRKYENRIRITYDPYGIPCYWLKSRLVNVSQNYFDSDVSAVKNRMVSITPLTIDITDYSMINDLKKIGFTKL
jgi:5'-nucleotidase